MSWGCCGGWHIFLDNIFQAFLPGILLIDHSVHVLALTFLGRLRGGYLLSWTKYCDSQFCIFGFSILDIIRVVGGVGSTGENDD